MTKVANVCYKIKLDGLVCKSLNEITLVSGNENTFFFFKCITDTSLKSIFFLIVCNEGLMIQSLMKIMFSQITKDED